MSDRDPVLHGPYSPQYMMNPTANNFAPTRPQQNGTASQANDIASSKTNGSTPPHLRAASVTSGGTVKSSLPPHLRGKKAEPSNDGSTKEQVVARNSKNHVTSNVQTDVAVKQIPMPAPTPPVSPKTVGQDQALSLERISLNRAWKPYHLTTLDAFSGPILPGDTTVTFHPDFLANILGGSSWSPGLRFVKGKGPCILKNRTYYQLDPQNEPYLPEAPGDHGAKLTAFFNKAPEEEFADLLDDDSNSYENVPMFVLVGKRYMYYGNYSQTRWSDKLDYDTMTARVPQHVKNYWAEELTSTTREEWVTEELKKHFFRKPEYEGRLSAALDHETTIDSHAEIALTEKMTKDVRKYVEQLREWEREANMKTAMIKKQSILKAFDASDMDEEPALRLWWEYLECVDWRKDFYDLLVTLQGRNPGSYLQ